MATVALVVAVLALVVAVWAALAVIDLRTVVTRKPPRVADFRPPPVGDTP